MEHSNPPRLLRKAVVCERLGLAISTLEKLVRNGDFPPPRKVTGHAVAWLESEVNDWVSNLPSTREVARDQ